MARGTPNLESFAGGETSRKFQGRVGHEKYYVSTRSQDNMISMPWGPVTRRPGTLHLAETKVSADASRLLPFVFSDIQAYMKEAGDKYFRFFKDKARIFIPAVTAVITNGTFTSDISGWADNSGAGSSITHDAANGRMNLTSNGTTTAEAEQQVTNTDAVDHTISFEVFGVAGDGLILRVGTTTGGAEIMAEKTYPVGTHTETFTATAANFFVQFVNNGFGKTIQLDTVKFLSNEPLELPTPYAKADVFKLKYTQSNDVFYITAQGYAWRKLSRTGHTSWSLTEIATVDGPYFEENIVTTSTLAPSAATGLGITITAAGGGFVPFAATDVGRLVRIKHGATWGNARITAFTDTTHVTADVKTDFGATTAQSAWRLGLYSDTTGHPAAVMFHEERLFTGGSIERPGRYDGSKSGDFENFTPGTADDDPIAVNIAANKVPNIRWFASTRVLLVGTESGEAKVGSASLNTPLTPSNTETKFQTRYGSDDQLPLPVANAILFVQKHGRKLRELVFKLDVDGFVAPDLTILAEHISRSKIVELAWQQDPWSIVWGARTDGKLIGMTYLRDEDVVAWHPHPLGGAGKVRSVATIPGANGDELWMIVERTINGATKRYIEVLADALDDDDDPEDAFYVDSGLTLDAPLTISGVTLTNPVKVTVTGHTFSNGDKIRIKNVVGTTELNKMNFKVKNKTANDFDITDDDDGNIDGTAFTAYVSGGEARARVTTISNLGHLEGEKVQILGDGAAQDEQTVVSGAITITAASVVHVGLGITGKLKPQRLEGAGGATKVGKTQRVISAWVLFERSGIVKIGRDEATAQVIEFRDQDDKMDQPVPLFSGFRKVDFKGNYDRDGTVLFVFDGPEPATILSIIPDVNWAPR